MADKQKVAIITGGASGMGLAVTQALAARKSWAIHVIDVNPNHLEEVSKSSSTIMPHEADVTDYAQLSSVFQEVHTTHQRLDFVFANAGILEKHNFYKIQDTTPPPPLELPSIEVNLIGVIQTSYLAQHYFRQSSTFRKECQSLVMTASCGGLYPSHYSPVYSAAKHGVIGLGRAIANRNFQDGIRVNIICPGIVETNLLGEGGWGGFPKKMFTPTEQIAKTVLQLVDAKEDLVDAKGQKVPVNKLYGVTVEVNLDRIYVRDVPEFCDGEMKWIMELTDPEKQAGHTMKDA